MSAKIILLSDYRRSTVRCPITGVTFPQVYRRTGQYWDFKDGENARRFTEVVPGAMSALEYVLAPDFGGDIADPLCEPIACLDPKIDSGWVIIRHHLNADRVNGYVTARGDLDLNRNSSRVVWQTPEGLFSVVSRPPTPGCPDHLMVFSTTVPNAEVGEEDWMKVIDAAGVEHDEKILYPPETI